jgi:hypothetical protein
MSKKFKNFMARRQTALGNLEVIQRNYITNNRTYIDYCIAHKLPMYFMALTQSGKTFLKFELALQAIKSGLVDNVIINSTNLVGANRQLFNRAVEWQYQNGMSVKTTTDKNAIMNKGDVFINMSNAGKLNRVDIIVQEAEKYAKKYNHPQPRILVINDEGEEFHQHTETSLCDTALGNLLNTKKHNIVVAKVSATLLSHLLVHGPYSSLMGYLDKRQVYKLPIHPDYKGLNVPHFIEPVLLSESNFNAKGYVKKATLRNTSNIRIVVDEIEKLIAGQRKVGDSKQTRLLPQVGNIVFGDSRTGHEKASGMLARAFQLSGRTVSVWNTQDFYQLNSNTNIVIIIHNGNATRAQTVAEKLSLIAHNWNRSELKAVVIISKKMLGKSITVECDNSNDPKSPEFGFYANFTAYYGQAGENITFPIQAMRCTGIRPEIKRHVMWTTDEIKQEIENYNDEIDRFVSHLNSKGVMDTTELINWNQKRPIAKAKVQKQLGILKGNTKSDSIVIENSERQIAVQADMLIKVTSAQYKQLNNKQSIIKFAVAQGFVPMSQSENDWEVRSDRAYANGNIARNAFKNHGSLQVKAHWVKQSRGWLLYLKNNMVAMPRVEYVAHKLDVNGRPVFDNSRYYVDTNNMGYTYMVK